MIKMKKRNQKVQEKSHLEAALAESNNEFKLYKLRAQTALKQKEQELQGVVQLEAKVAKLEREVEDLLAKNSTLQDLNRELQVFEASCQAMASEIRTLQNEKTELSSRAEMLKEQLRFGSTPFPFYFLTTFFCHHQIGCHLEAQVRRDVEEQPRSH